MKIKIKNYIGEGIVLNVDPSNTINMVKNIIQEKEGISCKQQRLILEGEELNDTITLSDYNIKENTILQLGARFQPPKDNDMNINILNSLGEKMMLKVLSNDTVREVKLKIEELENIPIEKQHLIFSGLTLEDWKTLSEYNIKNNSSLQLNVNLSNPEIITIMIMNEINDIFLDMKVSDTIKKLKTKIQHTEGIQESQQRLIFNGIELEDNNTLSFYNINSDSIIYLEVCFNTLNAIKVNITNNIGDILSLTVQPSESIEDIKKMITEEINIPFEQQYLSFNEVELENQFSLSDYNIKSGSTIHLTVRLYSSIKNNIPIFIFNESGEIINLKVNPSETINNIKTMIKNKYYISINQQHLFFDDNELCNEMKLSDYNIQENSNIQLLIGFQNSHNNKIKIYINNYIGELITLYVKPTDTIEKIKTMIKKREKIPINQQILTFNNIHLDNDFNLSYYNINKESILNLDYQFNNNNNNNDNKSNQNTQIYIKNIYGDSFTLDVQLTDRVEYLKEKIKEKIEFLPEHYYLYYKGKKLDNNKTLSNYHIKMGTTIKVILRLRNMFNIFIKDLTGDTFSLKIQHSYSFENIKSMIIEKTNYSLYDFDLFYNHKKLKNHKSFSNYNIPQESIIHAVKNNSEFQIFVINLIGKTIVINVKPSNTIQEVKQKIEMRDNIPIDMQILNYSGKILDNNKTIYDYFICKYSTLHLSSRLC